MSVHDALCPCPLRHPRGATKAVEPHPRGHLRGSAGPGSAQPRRTSSGSGDQRMEPIFLKGERRIIAGLRQCTCPWVKCVYILTRVQAFVRTHVCARRGGKVRARLQSQIWKSGLCKGSHDEHGSVHVGRGGGESGWWSSAEIPPQRWFEFRLKGETKATTRRVCSLLSRYL